MIPQMCVAENKLGNEDAVFYTAAVWTWNSDMQTGNFVPAGAAAQTKIAESRLYVAFLICVLPCAHDSLPQADPTQQPLSVLLRC